MHKLQLVTVALLSLLYMSGFAHGGEGDQQEDSFSKGASDLEAVITFVHAEWCSPCHQVDREILNSVEGRALWEKLKGVSVDFDTAEGQAFTKKHRILSLPTILVSHRDGNEIGRIEGFHPPAEYLTRLTALVRGETRGNEGNGSVQSASDVLRRARAALMAGEETRGVELCRQVQRMDAANEHGAFVDAAKLLARYWIRVMGQPEKGVLELAKVLVAHPGHPGEGGTVFWLAKGHHEQGEFERSKNVFARYVKDNPTAKSHLIRAHFFHLNKRERHLVRTDLETSIRLDSSLGYAYFLLAEVSRDQGDEEKAREYVDKALEINPEKAIFEDFKKEL